MTKLPRTVVLAALAWPSALAAQGIQTVEQQNVVTVSGTATVVMKPDLAVITLGVSTRGATVRKIVDDNNANVARIIAHLKSSGLKPEQIQTSEFVLRPTEKDGVNTGYEVRNAILVSTSRVSEVGAMIDAAIDSGANEIQGPQFSVQDEKAVQARCFTAAFGDAKSKAKKLAELSERPLGRVLAVTDHSSSPFEFPSGVPGGIVGGIAIESGTHLVECGVTAAFELK